MTATLWDISLAGLLHDVGKLGQRAFGPDEGLSEQSLRMKDVLCPTSRGTGKSYHTHLHVLYTNEFLNQVEQSLPSFFTISDLINRAVRHHRPESEVDELIAEADRLASAVERVEQAGERSQSPGSAFRRIRSYPISAEVQLETGPDQPLPQIGHRIKHWLDDSTVLFPLNEREGELRPEYNSLWTELLTRWKQNRVVEPWGYIARALSDMEACTWCVPAATNAFPDVSLFDHGRAVSAIAGCLLRACDSDSPFILVAGDFGGIQRYIFDLRHIEKGFAKILRGRSLTVRLFAEQVVAKILIDAEVPLSHRILSAGGRMYLLLPNDELCHTTLKAVAADLDAWSLVTTDGELHFNIGWTKLNRNEMRDFSSALYHVNNKLESESNRALEHVLKGDHWNEKEFLRPRSEDTGQALEEDLKLGQQLPKSVATSFIAGEVKHRARFPFGRFKLVREGDRPDADSQLVLGWGDVVPDAGLPYQRLRLARHVPRNRDGELLTFQEIADRATGRSALGFVKADVDNLGLIFSQGLKGREDLADRTSISHVATLSRSLEGFFGGFVENLAANRFPLIYLVYSGGDDLLAVGPWDQALQFICALRSEFDAYVGGNKDWGLSAGVLITHCRTPLNHAVDEAEALLEKAKARPGKDSLTVFDRTHTWNDGRRALELGQILMDWVAGGVLNVSKIRRLLGYCRMFESYRDTGDTSNLRYIYQLVYDLKRNWNDGTQEEQRAKAWAQTLADPSCEDLPALAAACLIALYGSRRERGD